MNNQFLLFVKTITITSILFAGTYSVANDNIALKEASEAACNKMKMCIKKQTSEEEGLSPEMIEMINQIAESSCSSLYQINELTAFDNLVKPVTKCFNAMAKSSCSELEEGKEPQACLDLEKEVEKL